MCPWRDATTPELCGSGRSGPSRSRRPTDAATDSCSASLNPSHHTPNSSVYSMHQSITLEDYNVKGILRALGKAWPFPHIAVVSAIGQIAEPAPARMDAAHAVVVPAKAGTQRRSYKR